MDAFITFLWKPKDTYRSQYTPEHVNLLHRGIRRFYPKLKRFICFTDHENYCDFDDHVEVHPLWSMARNIDNPTWKEGPGCYPRLYVWSREFAAKYDLKRFAVGDIDMVPVADLTPIFERTEPCLVWRTGQQRIPLCASLLMMDAGWCDGVWTDFIRDPVWAIDAAKRAGYRGSDQAWITYAVGEGRTGWTSADGVHAYHRMIPPRPPGHNMPGRIKRVVHRHLEMPITLQRESKQVTGPRRMFQPKPVRNSIRGYGMPNVGPLPKGARLVIFTGKPDPWDPEALTMSPWIEDFLWPNKSSPPSI